MLRGVVGLGVKVRLMLMFKVRLMVMVGFWVMVRVRQLIGMLGLGAG